jgi:choline transport protein
MILSLLNIATTVAFQAFIALTSMAIFASYLIAIGCMMYARYNGGLQLGEWNLGRYGMAVNVFAVIYTSYMLVFLPFPITLPVTGQNMNYALPIFAFVVFFAIGFWFIQGRKRWQGPVEEIIKLAIQE